MTEQLSGHRVVHAAALSTSADLASARADIHSAVQADDEHRRQQYALSARDNAAAVLLEPTSTPLELDYARRYFDDAAALVTQQAVAQSDSSREPS